MYTCDKKIAILLATYNGTQYLEEQLNSLEEQDFQDFKVFVHDDNSTDDTLEIINRHSQEHPGMYQLMIGPTYMNPKLDFLWMLKNVEADYYMFCDQDDVWMDNKISLEMKVMENISAEDKDEGQVEPLCVFSDMYVVDENMGAIAASFIQYIGRSVDNVAYPQVLIDNPASGNAMLFNRDLRDIAINISLTDAKDVEMHDAWVAVIAACFDGLVGIDEPLVYYRQTGENTLGAVTETRLDKVVRNTRDIVDGSFRAEKREFGMKSRKLAKILIKTPGIPYAVKDVLDDYIFIARRPRAYRMAFYRKYGFSRASGDLWFKLFV